MGLFGSAQREGHGVFRRQGQRQFEEGYNEVANARGGLDDLDQRFNAELEGGALPSYIEDAFARGQGQLTDDATRSRRSFAEDLLQIARRSGGRFDPNSAVDYQIEREASIDEDLFSSRNELANDESLMRMENTNRLLDRIFAIRDRKLGSAEAQRSEGLNVWLEGLNLSQRRSLARAQMASSAVTAGTSSMGSGGR
jgi:hypothetical protein